MIKLLKVMVPKFHSLDKKNASNKSTDNDLYLNMLKIFKK